jgi:hypothetical protein
MQKRLRELDSQANGDQMLAGFAQMRLVTDFLFIVLHVYEFLESAICSRCGYMTIHMISPSEERLVHSPRLSSLS